MTVVNRQTADGITTVTLDRPEALNAFNNAVFDELCDAFSSAATDDQCKVLVLTGAGRAFSAGADLKAKGIDSTPRHGLAGLLEAIIDFAKPFVVAANGLGVGGLLVPFSDGGYSVCRRIGAIAAFLVSRNHRRSVVHLYFPRLLGHQRASWILLSAEWVSSVRPKMPD